MPPGEVACRTRSFLRDRADHLLVDRRQQVRNPAVFLNGNGSDTRKSLRLCDMTVGDRAWLNTNDEVEKWWYDSLMARAERIAEHQIDLFNLRACVRSHISQV